MFHVKQSTAKFPECSDAARRSEIEFSHESHPSREINEFSFQAIPVVSRETIGHRKAVLGQSFSANPGTERPLR